MSFFVKYPEVLPLAVNLLMLVVAGCQRQWGKSLYWLGACILTIGILVMKG